MNMPGQPVPPPPGMTGRTQMNMSGRQPVPPPPGTTGRTMQNPAAVPPPVPTAPSAPKAGGNKPFNPFGGAKKQSGFIPEAHVRKNSELNNAAKKEAPKKKSIEDIDMALIRFLAKKDSLKALLLVYETSGSTPVKTGAMMAIDKKFKTVGTIGGGCGEDKVLRQAWWMIGSGQQCSVTIEMNNDIAAEEGMVCGGSMKVFVADIV